jgi:hypothetical protein
MNGHTLLYTVHIILLLVVDRIQRVIMGNCMSLGGLKHGQQRESDGLVVDARRRSFSKRMDMWEKTGTVAFRQSQLTVRGLLVEDSGMVVAGAYTVLVLSDKNSTDNVCVSRCRSFLLS